MFSLADLSFFFRPENEAVQFKDILAEELIAISAKRKKCSSEDGSEHPEKNLFGIALSGGGIRSATLNLGVLEVLNRAGILPKADYLSTVSGGGYTGGYVQAKLRNEPSFENLFKDVEQLKNNGFYLTPGKGFRKFLNEWRFWGAFAASLIMNWVWIFLFFLWLLYIPRLVLRPFFELPFMPNALWIAAGVVLAVHFFLHSLRHLKIWSSDALNRIEGALLFLILAYLGYQVLESFSIANLFCELFGYWTFDFSYGLIVLDFLIICALLILTGFFANPNILSMHRFYRDRLASAFLKPASKGSEVLRLNELNQGTIAEDWGMAPYPLINTCLNLMGERDEGFKGTKASDYFLLSPLFCGSKRTGYLETKSSGYRTMTLSTAVAVSGAALNPSMGTKTNRFLSFFMTLFNLKLGYWALNPTARMKSRITWWPPYLLSELRGRTDTKMWRVNLSDGGHIENLGIYELLRRRCKLIIAIDAGEDSKYDFPDLRNLVVRARNELGVAINFKPPPEEIIRPSSSEGFSKSHFVIANLEELPDLNKESGRCFGLLVYLKSSMKEQKHWKEVKESDPLSRSFHYKTYHPEFPHESTADQFFEPAQWEAYYNLGRFMAGDLINVDVRDEIRLSEAKGNFSSKGIEELYDFFSSRNPVEAP